MVDYCNFISSTASAHVRCQNIHDYMAIANDLKEFFHNEGIHSTTIQPEFEEHPESPDGCMLECGPEKNCAEQTCCGSDDKAKNKPANSEKDANGDKSLNEEKSEDMPTEQPV
eukprot:Seg844.6 transcript_id=Seg844.6/GoldUCD/mRNA.D3Y31 product="Zinc transporter 1" protein_id=Seg844.6/GoldUCD/D3Y31